MLLKEQDAVYAADKFINYFSNMDRIDEYLRNVKIERVLSRSPLSQFYEEEDTHGMFTAYDMHPEDMDIACYEAKDLKKQVVKYLVFVHSKNSMRSCRLQHLMR